MKLTKTIKGVSLIVGLAFSQANAQTATVNLGTTAQTIRGFGGINHPEWYSDLNAAERQLAYGNGAGQLGFTVLRTYVSDNSANFGRGIETAKYAYNQGAIVFASPWNPPAGQFITVNGVKRINPATYAQYADHLNSYVTYMKGQGVNLYAISTQNEPDYAHDWTEWSPQESVNFIKGFRSRINCKLMSPESFQYRKAVYDPILNDAAALANVDIFGAHLYGTQYKDFPYPLFVQKGAGKELWMTEVYTDSKFDANLWTDAVINNDQHALKVAEHIHYAMVDGNFQTYVFWPLRRYYALIHDGVADGQGNNPAAAGSATKRGYCMAQFSKWVRPGYVRVDATKSPSTNVFVSAYKKDNDVVIVVVNKNTGTRSLTLSIPGTQVTSWEQYTTSASKNIAKGSNINSGASFQVTLDAASVTTFVGKAVAVPQGAYNGIVHPIPGIIQMEHFDVGGNGVAYNDAAAGNTGGATFRTDEEVDLETCTDVGGGYNLGFATAAEWLEYTVNVQADGNYDLDFRVACNGADRTVSVAMNGASIASNVAIPNTTGWQVWQTVSVKNIPLTAGQKVMRFTIGATDYVNVNYLEFKKSVITGLEDEQISKSVIFPNPFTVDGFSINKAGSFRYKITDMSGVVMEQGEGQNKQSVGTQLVSGVYLLTLEQNGEVTTHKVIRK